MPRFRVRTFAYIERDGVIYNPGDLIDIPISEARRYQHQLESSGDGSIPQSFFRSPRIADYISTPGTTKRVLLESSDNTYEVTSSKTTEIYITGAGASIGTMEAIGGALSPISGNLSAGARRVAISYPAVSANTPANQKVEILGTNLDGLNVFVGDYTVNGSGIPSKVVTLNITAGSAIFVREENDLTLYQLGYTAPTSPTVTQALDRATIAQIAADPDAVVLLLYQGQSNQHGRDAQSPAPWTYTDSQIYFKADPSSTTDDGAFSTIEYGVNLSNPVVRLAHDIYGVHALFAREWELDADTSSIPLYLAGYAQDGQGFFNNSFGVGDPLYERMTQYYFAPAIRDLTALGKNIYVLLMTTNGEAEAVSTSGVVEFQTEFPAMVEAIRSSVGASDMPVTQTRLNDSINTVQYPNGADVAAFQTSYANGDADIQVINTDDIAMETDNIHYQFAGYQAIAQRHFAAAKTATLSLVTAQPNLPFLSGSGGTAVGPIAANLAGTGGEDFSTAAFQAGGPLTNEASGTWVIRPDGNGIIGTGGATELHTLSIPKPAISEPIFEMVVTGILSDTGTSTRYFGVMTRFVSNSDYIGIFARQNSGNQIAIIERVVASNTTTATTGTSFLAPNDSFILTVQDDGSEIRAQIESGGQTVSVTATTTSHGAAEKVGIYGFGAGHSFTNVAAQGIAAFTI